MEYPGNGRAVTRIVLVVEYDGTAYFGFQWQEGQPTVQDELEKAILQLTGERTRVVAASRTDTGVHAAGQVVSFRTASTLPLGRFVSGLNHYLPADVAVRETYRPDETFHVQRSAVSREYEYRILNRTARSPLLARRTWLVSSDLHLGLMTQACGALVGEHDFASFTSGPGVGVEDTVRRVYRADLKREGELVIFSIVANSYLPHQIRNMVGALVRVGQRQVSVSEFCSIMERRQHGLAGPKAPAAGLCLVRVNYSHLFEEQTNENV
jgi:tRNA pseudouridine38-40 synthase